MKIAFLPKTTLGKWSVALVILCFVLFAAASVSLSADESYKGFDFIVHNPVPTIASLIISAGGITAFGTGLVSVIKNGERSLLVYPAMVLGLYNATGFISIIQKIFFT